MATQRFKTTINCANCLRAITPALNAEPAITAWQVDTANPDKVLTVTTDLPAAQVATSYDHEAQTNRDLLLAKNHDYGEAWRQMRVSSITDLILMKLHRIKQLEDIGGAAWVSEGVEGGYRDMLNYAVFALILREESKE